MKMEIKRYGSLGRLEFIICARIEMEVILVLFLFKASCGNSLNVMFQKGTQSLVYCSPTDQLSSLALLVAIVL